MSRILLLGANGQVGWELQRALAPLGALIARDRSGGDLNDPEGLKFLISKIRPTVIVNAAAYTAVDKAESDVAGAYRINCDAVAAIAQAAKELDAWLVHYSTDYVFDGQSSDPLDELARTGPLNIYGESKLEGEDAIRASGCRHLIFRTSWVYAARGSNFARTILRLAAERNELKVVADQIGAPTSAELIADVTALALFKLLDNQTLQKSAGGTYHLVATGETSWHGFARFLVREARLAGIPLALDEEKVLPISTEEYPLPARRPQYSLLSTRKLQRTFGINLPDWQQYAQRAIQELAGNKA
ncbi:dTDP-4-dehydrorhamnose reductase [Pseudomonas nitritireducens]|uniref:dTDP-4-dehydrorhamnose reductase n=1 Tax=Pseudomonas nitroreducens TaxID=46680 RepID=A0A7W7KPP9_PSENT|nr:dTDP-4-dehydrorhamnose reductase [Pseudomonas nitritireducens]MBB4866401.1 dTDP-4-dehydrorhamnose reductase [Pseudomonas nitritireducens]